MVPTAKLAEPARLELNTHQRMGGKGPRVAWPAPTNCMLHVQNNLQYDNLPYLKR